MKSYYTLTGGIVLGLLLSFAGQTLGEQVVFEGDSSRDVFQKLGEPNIEFPRGKTMLRWYEEYELEFIDDKVSSVLYKPNKTPTIEIEVVKTTNAAQMVTNVNQQLADGGEELMGVEPDANAIEQAETNVMDDVESAVTNLEPLVTETLSTALSVATTSAAATAGP